MIVKKVLLTILDGIGINYNDDANALKHSNIKNYNKLLNMYPNARLDASERKIGLQKGVIGNCEIGHMTLGAGRIIKQNLMQMEELFDNEVLNNNDTFNDMIEYVNNNEIPLHIMVLVSDSGIHSHIKFVLKMIDILHENSIYKVYFHAILDGKESKTNAINLLLQINSKLKFYKMGTITTICGRIYAMDKNNDYNRIKIYTELLTNGKGVYSDNIKETLSDYYNKGFKNENMPPIILNRNGIIKDNSALLCLNYRKDSIVEILKVLSDASFSPFEKVKLTNLKIYTIYNIKEVKNNYYLLDNTKITNSIGVYLSNLGLTQARIAEISKYVYINFYFDGCQDLKLENCDRFLIPSKEVDDITKTPEMSTIETAKQVLRCMERDYDFIVVNFGAADILANTNDFDATKKALEIIDMCLGKIYEFAQDNFYTMFILSDHGNCENFLKSGNTLNPVSLIVTDDNIKLNNGCIVNVAPTILKYMDIAIPKEMSDTDILIS